MPTSLAATLNMKMAVKKWIELINSSMIDFVSAAGYLIAIIFDSGWFFLGILVGSLSPKLQKCFQHLKKWS